LAHATYKRHDKLSGEFKYLDPWEIYTIFFFGNQEIDTVELAKNLCLSCKEVYDNDNITTEQQDVHDNNFCPICWEQLKNWNVSNHS
jgi:hypothetical protein